MPETNLLIYERDDRDDLVVAMNLVEDELVGVGVEGQRERGMSDMLSFSEAMWLAEHFGLSIVFHDDALEWEVFDPKRLHTARANTPVGAIVTWDELRKGTL